MRLLLASVVVLVTLVTGCAGGASSPPIGRDDSSAPASGAAQPPAGGGEVDTVATVAPTATLEPIAVITPPDRQPPSAPGGSSRFQNASHVVRATATIVRGDEAPVEISYVVHVKGNHYRVETTSDQGTTVALVDLSSDTTGGYYLDTRENTAIRLDMSRLGLSPEFLETSFQTIDPQEHDDWQYIGQEEALGVMCKLYQRLSQGSVEWFWVDASTDFLVRHARQTAEGQEVNYELVVEEVRFANHPDSLFSPPAGALVAND